jgi:hypothetical protein
MATIVIDIGDRVLTDGHVQELIRLKRGAPNGAYYLLAKLAAAVEQAVADAKVVCPKCGKRRDDTSASLTGGAT